VGKGNVEFCPSPAIISRTARKSQLKIMVDFGKNWENYNIH